MNTKDYRLAPGGEGPQAAQWKDKPHRLIYDLCSEVERLTAALRFYANEDNWKEHETGIGMIPSDADMDGGSKARDALLSLEKNGPDDSQL